MKPQAGQGLLGFSFPGFLIILPLEGFFERHLLCQLEVSPFW